jgi:RNA polymerase sigma-70 factor (ECF subfamily)
MKSDADLVGRVLQGDKKAFRSLVDKYKQAVYSVILSITRNETEAQDLTQETLIKAYLNLESLKDRTKFGRWLSAIAHNVACNWLERNRTHESLEGLIEQNGSKQMSLQPCITMEAEDEFLQKDQLRQVLWKGIYSIPEACREALLLFYMREMKRKDIADFLGISESAVRNRIY